MHRMQANPLGHELTIMYPTWTPYAHNVHRCMNQALDGGYDFLLSMDDDNPPTRNPLELVDLDLDLVGLPTPVWHSEVKGDRPYYFNAYRRVEGGYKPCDHNSGLHEVDAVGSGCFLVSRRVMAALRYDQPFARQWNKDGTVGTGGDLSFCEKVKAKDFRIWASYNHLCDHMVTLPLLEVIQAFGAMFEQINGQSHPATHTPTDAPCHQSDEQSSVQPS